jgi:hypothetical protein
MKIVHYEVAGDKVFVHLFMLAITRKKTGNIEKTTLLVRLMTLQKLSSGHAPSKFPFDQSPPHPPGFTAGE